MALAEMSGDSVAAGEFARRALSEKPSESSEPLGGGGSGGGEQRGGWGGPGTKVQQPGAVLKSIEAEAYKSLVAKGACVTTDPPDGISKRDLNELLQKVHKPRHTARGRW